MLSYKLFGRRVACEFPLGTIPTRQFRGTAFVEVRKSRRKLPSRIHWYHRTRDDHGHFFGSFGTLRGTYFIHLHGEVDFAIRNGGKVVECLFPGTPVARVEAHLLSFVIPLALLLRGDAILHASAVEIDGKAAAFVGSQGFGKSTLAAAFVRQGFRVLSDDALRLVVRGQRILAYPSFPEIRLSKANVPVFLGAESLRQSGTAFRKKRAPLGKSFCHNAIPLEKLFFLERGPRIRVRPVESKQAWFNLLNHCYRINPNDSGLLRGEFASFSAIADRVPARELTYPRRLERLPQVIEAVLAQR